MPRAKKRPADKPQNRQLTGHLKQPKKKDALASSYKEFERSVTEGIEPLVPERTIQEEFKDKFGDKYGWDEPPSVQELEKYHEPVVAFEPQLHRINRVLHYWLEQCHRARFEKPEEKFRSIATMTKALHENLRIVLDVVRLLHEIYDTRTFNRLVLDAIKGISPELRLKIVQQLQQARQQMTQFKQIQGAFNEDPPAGGSNLGG